MAWIGQHGEGDAAYLADYHYVVMPGGPQHSPAIQWRQLDEAAAVRPSDPGDVRPQRSEPAADTIPLLDSSTPTGYREDSAVLRFSDTLMHSLPAMPPCEGGHAMSPEGTSGLHRTFSGRLTKPRNAAVRVPPSRSRAAKRPNWVVINEFGAMRTVAMDRRQLCKHMELDIPSRDMRLLDPSAHPFHTLIHLMLVRENAIVLCMEHVRLIISSNKVLSPVDPTDAKPLHSAVLSALSHNLTERSHKLSDQNGHEDDGSTSGGFEILPFELQALEVALREVSGQLGRQVEQCKLAVHSTMEVFAKAAQPATLERVRRVKAQVQLLKGRVGAVRDVLERYLQDDSDMWKLCLSYHASHSNAGGGTSRRDMLPSQLPPSRLQHHGSYPRAPTPPLPPVRRRSMGGMSARDSAVKLGGSPGEAVLDPVDAAARLLDPYPRVGAGGAGGATAAAAAARGSPFEAAAAAGARAEDGGEVEDDDRSSGSDEYEEFLDAENLLESYFGGVSALQQRLAALQEYIEDTEDMVNIELDYKRNGLIRIEVIITTAMFAFSIHGGVASTLGENTHFPDPVTTSGSFNYWVNAASLTVSMMVFLGCVIFLKLQKLI